MASDTIRHVTRSLHIYEMNGLGLISLCTEDGKHVEIELGPRHMAALNEGTAKYVRNVVLKNI